MLHSSARSLLFNVMLMRRIEQDGWFQPLNGEVWTFDDSHTVFGPESPDADLLARIRAGEVHATAVLWGKGRLQSADQVAQLEQAVVDEFPEMARGLESHGVRQQRRAVRAWAHNLVWQRQGADLWLDFRLQPGCFATALVRELVNVRS
jgi:tRNA pseudouridine13 synthase